MRCFIYYKFDRGYQNYIGKLVIFCDKLEVIWSIIILFQFKKEKSMKLQQIREAAISLKKYGYAVIPKFISAQICHNAIQQTNRLIDNFVPTPQQITIFTSESDAFRLSDYFLSSASKVSFFFEKKAWQNGQLTVPKRNSINKIGHALHQHNDIFRDITYTDGVQQLCYEVGINNPMVMQSMAILKPPKIGGVVNIHQDSTFLFGEPDTLLGFWIPLQDATKKNGCLWGLPGSHLGKLYSRSKVTKGVSSYDQIYEPDYKAEDFVPLEMEKGSLAIFTGKFLHMSQENTSQHSRYAYTWHLMDKRSKWSDENWLQRDEFPDFPLKNKK